MSDCSGAMLPRPGPPRITSTKTPGSSAPIMYERPSSIRLKPGEEVKVSEGSPAAPQPYIRFTAATSLTACRKTPSSFGKSLAISSAPSVEGVIG